jgi:D-glycero-alpha-D-manno-heptose-7-phosphate kinase
VIISRTPLCVSFLGGGSDLPAYYRRHGGAVLSAAVDYSIYVAVTNRFDDAISVRCSLTEETAHASQVDHPVVRESLALLGIERGIEITSMAEMPAKGTGLGSSSSFTIGLLNALHSNCGRYVNAERLAQESCHIELERLGEPIGKQDAYTVAFGGVNLIRFHPDDTVEGKQIALPQWVIDELRAHLLFFHWGVPRSGSGPGRQSIDLVTSSAKSLAMSEMVGLAEAGFTELSEGRIERFGGLLHANWRITEEMTIGISHPIIREAYLAARVAGAEGGRFLDSGGDGYLMLFAPPARRAAIAEALRGLRQVPLRFPSQGSQIIFVR